MAWSGDGRRILFSAYSVNLWDVSLARPGDKQKLPFGCDALDIAVSPSAYRLVYVQGVTSTNIWRLDLQASPPKGEQALNGFPESGYVGEQWFPFGSGIYFMSHPGGKDAIEFFDLKTEKVHRVYELEKPAPAYIGGMPVSSDGKWMLFPQVDESSSNLMMVENWH